jgi:sugar phosphate isomerase/epimerase
VHSQALADDFDVTTAEVDRLIAQYNVQPILLNTGVSPQLHVRDDATNAQRLREIDAVIRFMQHLNITTAAIQPRQPDRERPYNAVLSDCIATLTEQISAGQQAGVTFALELHVNSPFETLDQARQLLREMPDLPLVYDPSHFVMQGIDMRETEWLMDHARHVHVRDAAQDKMQVPLGTGAVDFNWLFAALKDRQYAGDFSIEYLETDSFDVLESAHRLYDRLQSEFMP